MGRHRGAPPPLRVRIDGYRLMYQPGPDGTEGTFTCVDSIMARVEAAFEAKALVPVNGVLVEADRGSVPGVLAACHAAAERQVFVEELPPEVDEWFAQHRAVPTPSESADVVLEAPGGWWTRLSRRKKNPVEG